MISLLLEPALYILKKHIALSGMDMTKNKVIESNGLDVETNLSKIGTGQGTVGIIYSRDRINKTGRYVDFLFYDENGLAHTRRGFDSTLPLDITIVTDQLTNLDNLELIHRMYLSQKQYEFNLVIPSLQEDVEKIPYSVYYTKMNTKSENPVTGNLSSGFRFYNFTIEINGYLLAPYVKQVDIVTAIDFKLISYNGDKTTVVESENTALSIYLPKS